MYRGLNDTYYFKELVKLFELLNLDLLYISLIVDVYDLSLIIYAGWSENQLKSYKIIQ